MQDKLVAYRLRLNLWLQLYIELPLEIIFATRESACNFARAYAASYTAEFRWHCGLSN